MKIPLNQKGFTLVEVMAVIILLGILFAVAIPRYITINKTAAKSGIDVAIIDLNGRDMKCWTEAKFSDGWNDDQRVFDSCDYQIANYRWVGLDKTGGSLKFNELMVRVNRRQSAQHEPANWSIEQFKTEWAYPSKDNPHSVFLDSTAIYINN